MNLNLELHFKPSCSLLKYQKEQGVCYPTIRTGHNLLLKRVQTPPRVTRGFLLPALIFPYLLLCGGCSVSAGRGSFQSPGAALAILLSERRTERRGMPRTANRDPQRLLHPRPEKRASQQAAAEKTSANPAGKRL